MPEDRAQRRINREEPLVEDKRGDGTLRFNPPETLAHELDPARCEVDLRLCHPTCVPPIVDGSICYGAVRAAARSLDRAPPSFGVFSDLPGTHRAQNPRCRPGNPPFQFMVS